jgi:hypothetical protein
MGERPHTILSNVRYQELLAKTTAEAACVRKTKTNQRTTVVTPAFFAKARGAYVDVIC